MDIRVVIKSLCTERPVFHSEADFQFALAWEIQRTYPTADVRLEYPVSVGNSNYYVDICVRRGNDVYPVELKYKTKQFNADSKGEKYNLKNQNAQDFSAYDFIKDIHRIEEVSNHLAGFKRGYTIWLTNDPHYWKVPSDPNVSCAQFSVHDGAVKEGSMAWRGNLTPAALKGREDAIKLDGEYKIVWDEYRDLCARNGLFRYALLSVPPRRT